MRLLGWLPTVLIVFAGWVALPPPGTASCADTETLEQVATEPDVAVFTGRGTGVVGANEDVVFTVDRWFQGPGAARVVLLLGWSATLVDPSTAGLVTAVQAKTVSGDAISLVRDEPVLMLATWVEDQDGFGVYPCSVAGLPLDSPEGRDALRTAEAVFGPGRSAAALPATDTLPADVDGAAPPWLGISDWWVLVLAFALATMFVLGRRRI
jgi:hypothetical protein